MVNPKCQKRGAKLLVLRNVFQRCVQLGIAKRSMKNQSDAI